MRNKSFLTLVLVLVFFACLFQLDWSSNFVNTNGLSAVSKMLHGMKDLDLSYTFFLICLKAVWITISYSFASMSIAILIAIPLGTLASGTLFQSKPSRLTKVLIIRSTLAILRSIHELIWAWLIAVTLGFTAISGVLALAIPYGAILARIYADLLQDVPTAPLSALESTGASRWQVFLYGRFQLASVGLVSYTMSRFECCMRSSAVLSFIGLQGIGYQINISLSDLLFGQVWMLLFYLILLIFVIDWWSGKIRRSIS